MSFEHLDTLPENTLPAARGVVLHGGRDDYDALQPVRREHYARGCEIARGGMGRIIVARDRRLGRDVALKESLLFGRSAQRFEREARITARLQHPSIVNVHEAGVWPSGEPFYAMNLVRGRSLDALVREAATFEARLALLPNVQAVADALAYAHSERVIHRDLKPHNVLVGAFGETVVVDWGLAKDLRDAEPGTDRAGAHVESSWTIDGEVMGTPAYMAPEQAHGRSVDERADVYAIGALLYHVLSGEAPYTGRSGAAVIDTVRERAPASLVEREPRTPPDLLAIVERAMARDPADSCGNAGELAADLRRFSTGQLVASHRYSLAELLRRWVRRHRAALSVAGAAMVVFVVLGALAIDRIVTAQRRAEHERSLALTSQASAEDLAGFMLEDLRDKLEPLGRVDLLGEVALKARAYYSERARASEPTDRELLALAIARQNVGDVLASTGDSAGALAEFRAALTLREAVLARQPDDRVQRRDLSVVRSRIAAALAAQGDHASALAELERDLAARISLADSDPTDGAAARDAALVLLSKSDILRVSGDVSSAITAVRAALARIEPIVQQEPTNVRYQRDLGSAHQRLGDLLLSQGDGEAALPSFRVALAIDEGLSRASPDDAELQRNLSVGHNKLGDVLSVLGSASAALAAYRRGLALIQPLAERDPTNVDRMRDLAISHANIGDMLLALDDVTGALESYREALVIAESLAAADAANAVFQQDLALTLLSVGDAYRTKGDRTAAREHYLRALAIHESLAAAHPGEASWTAEIETDRRILAQLRAH